MSHVTTCTARFKTLEGLAAAAEALGGVLVRDQRSYEWYGHWADDTLLPEGIFSPSETARLRAASREERTAAMLKVLGSCDHAIRFPGCRYEVGVVRVGDEWQLRFDYWDSALGRKMGGPGAGLFKQAYQIEAAKAIAKAQKRPFQIQRLADGTVKMVVQK